MGGAGSSLLLDECFATEDSRFVAELRSVQSAKKLTAFVERWKRDPRPWAREQIFRYLREPIDLRGHEVVVKRLFKHFEAERDDEVVGACLVAFDRLVRREVQRFFRVDGDAYLIEPRLRAEADWRRPFSLATSHYLRRRAWRYFRWMGYGRPDDYVPAVTMALARYTDEDLTAEAGILDSRSLSSIAFWHSDALAFGREYVNLREGRALREVEPAPRFPALWRAEAAFEPLLDLLVAARSRPIRTFAMKLLESLHAPALARLDADRVRRMLEHEDAALSEFAASLFTRLETLDRMTVDEWLDLLVSDNPTVLALLADAMRERVTPDRLGLADAARLAVRESVPVARLGLHFLGDRQPATPEDRALVLSLANARCAAVAGDLTNWALARVDTPDDYSADDVIEFFDAPLPEVRDAAWSWLTGGESGGPSRGSRDPVLFARLVETPYEDLRLRLVEWLDRRSRLPGKAPSDLTPVWTAVLLGVHRGGRQKQAALRQLSDAIARDPDTAESLLPVVAVAVRSVRGPEQRAGLAALARILTARPELEERVAGALPEVSFAAEETA